LQFIGAIVVQDLGKRGGSQSPNEYLIIDGQQRLTTIYLLLCGISWSYLQKNKIDDAKTIVETYLSFSAGKYTGMPKLLPTSQDRKQFYELLETDVNCIDWVFSDNPADESSHKKGIENQWDIIKKHMTESFFDSRNRLIKSRINKFLENILYYIETVQIVLEKKDDANTAFSKLNFLGIPLSIADLVRNDVFSRFDTNDMTLANSFYKNKWSPFEKSFPKDSFEQYVPIYALIKFKGNCPKSKAFPNLQKSWARKKPEKILNEIKDYAQIYSLLVKFNENTVFHKDVNDRIRRLSLMPKTTVTWPYIIQVICALKNSKISKVQTIHSLKLVESFLVRRAINGLEPTGLHAVFKGLWNKAGADKNKLKDKIVTSTIRCPEDDKVSESLQKDNMYKRQITKYLLIQRELSFNKQYGYDNATSDFSVEHVMPKNHTGEWKTLFSKDEHLAMLNSIGNLVPLTKKQNSDVKDSNWSVKRRAIAGSNWKFSQKASKLVKWDKKQIKKRTSDFAKWAIAEWPEVSKM
jgi:hypothetical protein